MSRHRPCSRFARLASLALGCTLATAAPAAAQDPDSLRAGRAATGDSIARAVLRLERSGRHARAESLLAASAELDARRRVALLVALGDLDVGRNELKAAFSHFERAIALAPGDLTPALRKAQVLAGLLPKGAAPLLAWGTVCHAHFPVVAEFAYQKVVEETGTVDAKRAEQALLSWVLLLAVRDRFVSGDTTLVLRSGLARPLAELRALLARPESGLPDTSWWRADPHRRNAIASVALSMGRSRAAAGDPAGAERRFRAGLELAGRPDALLGSKPSRSSRPIAYFGLASELATLYDAHRRFDPQGGKLESIVQALFHSKSEAYAANDLEAIQRHHMVLGTIYARRGTWESAWPPANGVFQIEKALEIAKQREPQAGLQPLAELKAMLAEGYERTDRRSRALDTRFAAAEAYLDQDDLAGAGEQLERAKPATAAERATFGRRHEQLGMVLESRRLVSRLQASPRDTVRSRLSEFDAAPHAWINGGGTAAGGSGLPKDFLLRQRFKTQSDLSDAAFRAGAAASAARYAASAVGIEPDKLGSLVGYGDMLRTEKLASQVGVVVEGGWSLVESGTSGGGKAWSLSGLEGGATRRVALSKDLVTGLKVADVVANDSDLAGSQLRIRSAGGKLVVDIPAAQAHRKDVIVAKLASVVGAKNVVVK